MAIQTKKKYTGQQVISTLSGRVRLEPEAGRIVVYDESGVAKTIVDIEGLKSFSNSQDEVVRSGIMPDGTYGLTAAKPGETIKSIYG